MVSFPKNGTFKINRENSLLIETMRLSKIANI